MGFRTLTINNRSKLTYNLNQLVIRQNNIVSRVNIDEIKLIIINSLQVIISSALICELSKRKIKIMFCNEKHNPECECVPYCNNFYSYRKINEQIQFDNSSKNYLWKQIIVRKINNQSEILKLAGKEEESIKLQEYAKNVEEGDTTNREGHAAKVYFNALFGNKFCRKDKTNDINKYLNYGYAIIVSAINRSIKASGYLTELGIHHIGDSNSFNLAYDLIEPLRPLIDGYIVTQKVNDEDFKTVLADLMNKKVLYNGKEYFLNNAIDLYVEDIFRYLRTGDVGAINFIKYEL